MLVVKKARGHVVVEISPLAVTIAHGHFESKSQSSNAQGSGLEKNLQLSLMLRIIDQTVSGQREFKHV